jgi:hypothetical protein
MANHQDINHRSDELDIFFLIERALAYLQRFGLILLGFSLAGLAIGLALYFTSQKQYKSRLILHSMVLTNQEEIEIVGNWQGLLSSGERPALASIMQCDVALVNKLTKISADEIQKVYTQNNPNGFTVDVMVTDTSILDQLQVAIVNGMGSSDYVSQRIAIRKERFKEMIENVRAELSKLAITKNSIDSMIRTRSSGSSPMLIDISNLNSEWISLNEKLLGYQEELNFTNAVQVLQPFNKPRKPESPKLLKSVVFGVAAGAFIGYLLSLLLYVRGRLRASKKARIS